MRYLVLALCLVTSFAHADLSVRERGAIVSLTAYQRGHWCMIGTGFYVGPNALMTAGHVASAGATAGGSPLRVVWRSGDAVLCYTEVTSKRWLKVAKRIPRGAVEAWGDFRSKCEGGSLIKSLGEVTNYPWCSAVVRPGYSGGPVVDRRTNRVIGLVSMRHPLNGHCLMAPVDDLR